MRDDREIMIAFVEIVQRHPEIYDNSMGTYRTKYVDYAWAKVAESVRSEIKEACTVEELKAKWKGIRSSYNRFKNKLVYNKDLLKNNYKKYYLYDSLRFLDPFMKSKSHTESQYEECGQCENREENEGDYSSFQDRNILVEVKSEMFQDSEDEIIPNGLADSKINDDKNDRDITESDTSSCHTEIITTGQSKTKCNVSDDSGDMQFFKSILPDIKHFSPGEKRKLKMGILRLIDEIEDERKALKN